MMRKRNHEIILNTMFYNGYRMIFLMQFAFAPRRISPKEQKKKESKKSARDIKHPLYAAFKRLHPILAQPSTCQVTLLQSPDVCMCTLVCRNCVNGKYYTLKNCHPEFLLAISAAGPALCRTPRAFYNVTDSRGAAASTTTTTTTTAVADMCC
jgi:hypothetical protein